MTDMPPLQRTIHEVADSSIRAAISDAIGSDPDILSWRAYDAIDDPEVLLLVSPNGFCSAVEVRERAYAALRDALHRNTSVAVVLVDSTSAAGMSLSLDDVGAFKRDSEYSVFIEAATDPEIQMASIWKEVLEVDRIGMDDDFLDLGGDSLTAVEITSLAEERLNWKIDLEDFFLAGTIRELVRIQQDTSEDH